MQNAWTPSELSIALVYTKALFPFQASAAHSTQPPRIDASQDGTAFLSATALKRGSIFGIESFSFVITFGWDGMPCVCPRRFFATKASLDRSESF